MINDLIGSIQEVQGLPGISVPASSGVIVNLLKVLTKGVCIGNNKQELLEVAKTAEFLGFTLNNCQLGVRKKKEILPSPSVSKISLNRKRKVQSSVNISKKVKVEVLEPLIKVKDEKVLFVSGPASTSGLENKVHKQFACSSCDKMFKYKKGLQRHKKDKHDFSTEEFSASLKRESDTTIVASESLEECPEQLQGLADPTSLVSIEITALSNEETKVTECREHENKTQVVDVIEKGDQIQGLSHSEENEESEFIIDPLAKEKLLADGQKLIEELNSLEFNGDLNFGSEAQTESS